MISRELKEMAFGLRKNGKSYNYIKKKLNISKGALSYWFNDKSWSKDIELKNREDVQKEATARILKLNEGRKKQIQSDKEKTKNEAEIEFEFYQHEPLFIGALMIYLGEGHKSGNSSRIGVANSDPYVLKIFNNFLKKYCKVDESNIKFWLLCYPDLDQLVCEDWWSKQLGISKENFYKTQVIQGKHKTNRLRYGVGNIIMSGSLLKVKILRWIELMSSHLARV